MKASRSVLCLAFGLLFVAGCQSDSPSEPRPVSPVQPVVPQPVTSFSVTVTANPPQIAQGSNGTSTITVQVRRTDSGTPPADLTPVTLSTTLGEFGNAGSGVREVTLQLVNGRASAVLFPGNAVGTATVRAEIERSAGVAEVLIGQAETFFISSVDPQLGNPQGGQEVFINGGGFDGPVRVTFGTATAVVRSVTPNRLRVVVPNATAAGVDVGVGESVPVDVGVTINVNEANQLSDTLAAGFTYALGGSDNRQPVVIGISPSSGSNDGGDTVTINGENFASRVQVYFQFGSPPVAIEATVQSVNPTRIVALTPAARGFGQELRNQTVDVRVVNLDSGFETTRPRLFRYGSQVIVTSFSPGAVLYNEPTRVTIFGQGFDEPVAAGLAGVAAAVLDTSGTEIIVLSPTVRPAGCADVLGPVSVVNIETGDGASGGTFRFIVPKPAISNLSPNSGPEAGNTAVTITGFNFEPQTRVVFGDQAGSIQSVASGQIVVRAPRFTGTFPSQACDDNGDGTQGQRFQPTSVDVRVINLGSTCEDIFQHGYTYTPADTSCRNDNAPAPVPQCGNGTDDDGDTLIDFPADPQCTSAADTTEGS
jgi:IPT/TIG domain